MMMKTRGRRVRGGDDGRDDDGWRPSGMAGPPMGRAALDRLLVVRLTGRVPDPPTLNAADYPGFDQTRVQGIHIPLRIILVRRDIYHALAVVGVTRHYPVPPRGAENTTSHHLIPPLRRGFYSADRDRGAARNFQQSS